jgi:hypothetical protein
MVPEAKKASGQAFARSFLARALASFGQEVLPEACPKQIGASGKLFWPFIHVDE